MSKFKPYKDLTDKEKTMYNYDRRQYRTKQAEFERKKVISVSRLNSHSIESIMEVVLDRLNPQTSHNHNHRPNLFDDNYLIGEVRHI